MAGNDCESQVFANVPEGFVKLLSFIVQVVMGPSVRPVFTLYPHKINDSLTMHQAAVQFKGGRVELRRFRFLGRAMPTERHAMQMAAREAIARLRDVLPSMKTRRYRYLPCHVPYTCHYAFACPRGERDEAIEMLVEYLKALEAAFDILVDDVVAARMDSIHGCSANRRELLHMAPPLTFVSSSASYTPAILATACLPLRSLTKSLLLLQSELHHLPCPHQLLSLVLRVWSLLVRRRLSLRHHWVLPSAGQRKFSPSPTKCA